MKQVKACHEAGRASAGGGPEVTCGAGRWRRPCTLPLPALSILVLDIRMPGMSGEKLQAKLKLWGVQVPIIVVTSDDDTAARRRARSLKAAGFFRKPVDGKALLDAIDWALRTIASDDKNHEMASDENGDPTPIKTGDPP